MKLDIRWLTCGAALGRFRATKTGYHVVVLEAGEVTDVIYAGEEFYRAQARRDMLATRQVNT